MMDTVERDDRTISISRPPLAKTFTLPTWHDLLDVDPGDLVKLICNDRERMWVEVVDCCHHSEWHGLLKNDPVTEECAKLAYNDEVEFHPLDVIDIMPFLERADLGDNCPEEW